MMTAVKMKVLAYGMVAIMVVVALTVAAAAIAG